VLASCTDRANCGWGYCADSGSQTDYCPSTDSEWTIQEEGCLHSEITDDPEVTCAVVAASRAAMTGHCPVPASCSALLGDASAGD
jgi:hypothetical protein